MRIDHGRAAIIVAAVFLLFTIACAAPQQGVAADRELSDLTNRMLEHTKSFRVENDIPGCTAAFVLPDGRIGAVAAGLSDVEEGIAMSLDDRLLSGSIGKTYVAAVALQLVNEGSLDLDARISRWLDGDKWFPRLPNGTDITVRMLMNHTSGIPEHVYDPEFGRSVGADPDRVWEHAELLKFVLDAAPLFPAGKGWSYADTNYIVLGIIIEKIAGRAYYEELERRILEPFGLDDTVPSDNRTIAGLVPGYAGEQTPFKIPGKTIRDGRFVVNPQAEWTGGGLACTTRDLARWGRILYTGKAFPPRLLEPMLDGVRAFTGPNDRYGLGVQIWPGPHGNCYGHGGWFPGYVSLLAYYPDTGLTLAVQLNTDRFDGGSQTLRDFLDRLAGEIVQVMH